MAFFLVARWTLYWAGPLTLAPIHLDSARFFFLESVNQISNL
jgi:hypothetical protein